MRETFKPETFESSEAERFNLEQPWESLKTATDKFDMNRGFTNIWADWKYKLAD